MSSLEISIKALIRRRGLPKVVDSPKVFGSEELQTYVAIMRKDGMTTKSVEGQVVEVSPTTRTTKTAEEEARELLRKISKQRGYKFP